MRYLGLVIVLVFLSSCASSKRCSCKHWTSSIEHQIKTKTNLEKANVVKLDEDAGQSMLLPQVYTN